MRIKLPYSQFLGAAEAGSICFFTASGDQVKTIAWHNGLTWVYYELTGTLPTRTEFMAFVAEYIDRRIGVGNAVRPVEVEEIRMF